MFQERENEVSLRKWSGGTAQLRTLEGTLPTTANVCRDSTRNEQVESVERVKTSVCRINFSGSSANVTLLSSRKILFPKQASAKVC